MSVNETTTTATATLYRYWVRRVGPGFHPDTDPFEYEPQLPPGDAFALNFVLECAFGLDRFNPYEEGLRVFKQEGWA